MGEIVNLRSVRKAKAREAAVRTASGNRARFGRTRGEKQRDAIEADRGVKATDNAKLSD